MSVITVENLTFAYDGSDDDVFRNVSFQLDTSWRLGFVGRNGRGKTTLLRLLMGELEYRGRISASVDFEYFPYPVPDLSLTARQTAQNACPDAESWRLERETALLGVEDDVLDRPFFSLSHGERAKVLLAALFLRDNAFLLIDEPTNHLDMAARRSVAEYLRQKSGFILVSHDRAFLDDCVDHILSINRANIEVQRGNFSSWMHNRELQDSYELAENERLKKDIKRLSAAAARSAAWSDKTEKSKIGEHAADRGFIGHKAAKMMKRSKAIELRRESAAQEKSALLRNVETSAELKLKPLIHHSRRLVELEDISISYGGRQVLRGLSLTVEAGERVAVRGKNGSGKTSLLRLIAGEEVPHTGARKTASGLIVSYAPQHTGHISGSLREFAAKHGIDESYFKAILRKLDFTRPQLEKDIEDLSEGQKKKVLISASLCQSAHLYIWDEPLNFIDVISRMQIEDMILGSGATMLFVEHDGVFCDTVATKTVELQPGT